MGLCWYELRVCSHGVSCESLAGLPSLATKEDRWEKYYE